jgi:hypothetical protein
LLCSEVASFSGSHYQRSPRKLFTTVARNERAEICHAWRRRLVPNNSRAGNVQLTARLAIRLRLLPDLPPLTQLLPKAAQLQQ